LACKIGPLALSGFLESMAATTFSTNFSGIDAPGTSLAVLRACCTDVLGVNEGNYSKPVHLHAIEYFDDSIAELSRHPCAPRCIFGDITQFYSKPLRDRLRSLNEQGVTVSLESLAPCIKSGTAVELEGVAGHLIRRMFSLPRTPPAHPHPHPPTHHNRCDCTACDQH
jgi:hypothetical protein